MQMLSVEKDSAVCCLVFRVGDGGSAWEILRGFEWGVGWYAMCPVPTTKQDGFTLKISQYLSKIPKNSHEQHLLLLGHCICGSTTAVRRNQQIPLAGRAVSPTDRRCSNQRHLQNRPIQTAG